MKTTNAFQYNVSLALIILLQLNNLERKNAVVKPLGSRTFPDFFIPKKRTQFFVYFA